MDYRKVEWQEEMNKQRKVLITITYNDMGIIIDTKAEEVAQPDLQPICNQLATDTISRQAAIEAMCGACSDWCDEGVCKKVSAIQKLPSAQPERTCVNCGRTANNGGWYADGGTRCPIEEHYALPKDGYCHLWEKRSVTDDDYPERREDG